MIEICRFFKKVHPLPPPAGDIMRSLPLLFVITTRSVREQAKKVASFDNPEAHRQSLIALQILTENPEVNCTRKAAGKGYQKINLWRYFPQKRAAEGRY